MENEFDNRKLLPWGSKETRTQLCARAGSRHRVTENHGEEVRSTQRSERERCEAALAACPPCLRPGPGGAVAARGCRWPAVPSRESPVLPWPRLISVFPLLPATRPKTPFPEHFYLTSRVCLCWFQMLETFPRKTGVYMRWEKPCKKRQYEKSKKGVPKIKQSKRATSPRAHPGGGWRGEQAQQQFNLDVLFSPLLLEIETKLEQNLSRSITTEFLPVLSFRMPVFSYL